MRRKDREHEPQPAVKEVVTEESLGDDLRGEGRVVAFGTISTIMGWGSMPILDKQIVSLVEQACLSEAGVSCSLVSQDTYNTLKSQYSIVEAPSMYLGIIGPLALFGGLAGFYSARRRLKRFKSAQPT